MGNCNVEKVDPLYIKHSRQQVEEHFMALIKLEHFDKREASLKNQAIEDMNKIIHNSKELIRLREDQILNSFRKDLKETEQDHQLMNKLAKSNLSVEEYIGYVDTKDSTDAYKEDVELKFNTLRAELQENMNMTFQSIKEDVEAKLIQFEENQVLTKEDISLKFQKWKLNKRDQVKMAVLEIQSRFKDELTHDYFRNKLKAVVSSAQVKRAIVRSKPRALSSKTARTQVIIEDEDIMGSTKDTEKRWFCCMPLSKR